MYIKTSFKAPIIQIKKNLKSASTVSLRPTGNVLRIQILSLCF